MSFLYEVITQVAAGLVLAAVVGTLRYLKARATKHAQKDTKQLPPT